MLGRQRVNAIRSSERVTPAARLEKFHRRCVRSMAGTNMFTTRKLHISAFKLEQRLGLRGIKSYVAESSLCWLGHVARMSRDKLPRRRLTAWVQIPEGIKTESKLGTTAHRWSSTLASTRRSFSAFKREAEFKSVESRRGTMRARGSYQVIHYRAQQVLLLLC